MRWADLFSIEVPQVGRWVRHRYRGFMPAPSRRREWRALCDGGQEGAGAALEPGIGLRGKGITERPRSIWVGVEAGVGRL